jgi:2-keto-4-pentenoate hydratase/2-oxohepta-3-ene-1,7-dioic acid hydratase in catechol pathway
VFCVGWNYSEHFEEGRQFRGPAQQGQPEIPAFPSLFTKNPATVIGPEAAIRFPSPHSEQLDWEAELAVVIGAGGCDIPESEAMRHVFGYMAANDVSVRDVQRRHGGQWFKGKNFDTHLPLGPWIVTADEVDPSDLAIRSRVNGVVKQDSRTRFMVFKIPRLIAEISAGCELWPGDVIITGTPAGVGFARTPPEYLKPGDVVEVEIEGIGTLRNIVEGGGQKCSKHSPGTSNPRFAGRVSASSCTSTRGDSSASCRPRTSSSSRMRTATTSRRVTSRR